MLHPRCILPAKHYAIPLSVHATHMPELEGTVVTEALDVIASGKPKMLEFGVADETAWRVGLSCGGRIRVYVEKLD